MDNFLGARDWKLSGIELRILIRKITVCVNDLRMRNIVHRDLNIDNIMLHFPEFKPNSDEMQDPNLLNTMEKHVIKSIQDLSNATF